MNKKNNLALFTFFVVGLLSLFTNNVFAQTTDSVKTEQSTKTCSGEKFVMPESISVGNDAFANYIKVASLPRQERQKSFRELSNEQKASFVKVQFAMQFVKRPNLTKQQRDFLLEAMSKVSVDLYDKENPQKVALSNALNQEIEAKAFSLFAQKDAFEILEGIGAGKDEDVALLQKYEDLLKNGMKMRKKIAKEMPVNDRVNIWKVQLAYHLATGKFSRIQNEFILEMLTSLSPETFTSIANLTKEESVKALEILDKKILSVFSKAESYAIFEQLGIQKNVPDIKETLALSPPSFNRTVNLLVSYAKENKPSITGGQYTFCDCRWYCGVSGTCGSKCNVEVQECGPTGSWYCTGKCEDELQ